MKITGTPAQRAFVEEVLSRYVPAKIRAIVERTGTKVVFANEGESFPQLCDRMLAKPPPWFREAAESVRQDFSGSGGCYQAAINTILLPYDCLEPGVVVHEFGHAVSYIFGQLGGDGVPLGMTPTIEVRWAQYMLQCFMKSGAKDESMVLPEQIPFGVYAARSAEEWFAECFRAFCEAPPQTAGYPALTRALLKREYPLFYTLFETAEGEEEDLRRLIEEALEMSPALRESSLKTAEEALIYKRTREAA